MAKQVGGKEESRAERLIWSSTQTPIGPVTVVASKKGVRRVEPGTQLSDEVAGAILIRDDEGMQPLLEAIRAITKGQDVPELPIDVLGTDFQTRVWAALRTIPKGEARSYTDIAVAIGSPKAVRAVARACAMNPVALVVPCHRVIRSNGELSGYAWGVDVKQSLLNAEQYEFPSGR